MKNYILKNEKEIFRRQSPLSNALCYSIMKLNKNMNRIKLSKPNKIHIYVYIITIFMHGSALKRKTFCIYPTNAERNNNLQVKRQNMSKSVSYLIGHLMKPPSNNCRRA